jgi:hypothetical protein
MANNNKVAEIKEKLDVLTADMVNIIGCLETVENSLFFSSERKDKDMTKPCAMCVNAITIMVDNCTDEIAEISEALEAVESEV